MADHNKKVNIEFGDSGSLSRLKQLFGQTFASMTTGQGAQSGLFGNLLFGQGGITQFQRSLATLQQQYLGPNSAFTKQLQQLQGAINSSDASRDKILQGFSKIDRERGNWNNQYSNYERRFDAFKNDPYFQNNPQAKRAESSKLQQEFDRLQDLREQLNNKEKNLLKGTGYRKRETFESGSLREISKAEKEFDKLLAQQSKTNEILESWKQQDAKQVKEQVKAIKENPNASNAEKAAADIYDEATAPEKQARKQAIAQGAAAMVTILAQGVGQHYMLENSFQRQLKMQTNSYDALGAYGEKEGNQTANGWRTAGSLTGAAIGGGFALAGATAGSVVPILGTAIGAALGYVIGNIIANAQSEAEKSEYEQVVRSGKARDEYIQRLNQFSALTGGRDMNFSDRMQKDMQGWGYSMKDALEYSAIASKGRGYRASERDVMLGLGYERGWGIDRGVSGDLMNLTRSSRGSDRDIQNIISGVFEKGKDIFKGDRTYLSEFLSTKFMPLQRELLRAQTHVSSGTTMDILSRFNAVGGQFDARHQNSSGLISQINNSLTSPGSDSTNAVSFAALRGANPGMSMFQLLKERQRGLSSPTYLSAVMKQVENMGGSEDIQKMQLAGMLGLQNNYDAVESLWDKRGSIMSGKISQRELRSMTSPGAEAAKYTSETQKETAQISNAIVENWEKAGKLMAEYLDKRIAQFKNEMANPTFKIDLNGQRIFESKVYDENAKGKGAVDNSTKLPGGMTQGEWDKHKQSMMYIK